MKRIFVKEEFCMGCELCDVYCKTQHSKSKDIIKAYKKEQPKPLSRLRVEKAKPVSFAVQCRHCEDPPCVNACLSGAMYVDEKTGLVLHNGEKCIGCWTCIMVCPFGALVMDVSSRKVVMKCDMCQGLEVPACVANCPNEALVYREVMP
ncbi:MAG: 4Fe-4S dicluster domain-containing protein [Candidatus Bathyarchaeia archaeon]